MKWSSVFSLPNLALSVAFLVVSCLIRPSVVNAREIKVNNASDIPIPGLCNLRQAVVSHNERAYVFPSSCEVGTDNDEITFTNTIGNTLDLGSPLKIESGRVKFLSSSGCINLRQSAYITISKGATLSLYNISIVVNGAEPLSIIDNDGGLLLIRNSTERPCPFSNQLGIVRKTSLGGVLHNRNGGEAAIDANFENSSAGDKGGAIYIDSGTVEIGQYSPSSFMGNTSNQGGAIYLNSGTLIIKSRGVSFSNNISNEGGGAIYVNSGTVAMTGNQYKLGSFTNNIANQGGAIYVNTGATLKVASNDFTFMRNRADAAGGAIYSNGGNVTLTRNSWPLERASIGFNSSGAGAAIYSAGGQLNIDGIEINNNSSSGSGGAILISNILPPTPASITRSYFHDNSTGVNGGAIYLLDGSTLNISASTFTGDRASGLGGSIYADTLSNLDVLNSTFLGGVNREGIVVASGLSNVVFSTIVAANLGAGSTPTIQLSNSILREVTCSTIVDDGLNLQFQSTGCPGSIPTTNPDLDPRFLENNGGPTPTIALLRGSPAINAIAIGDCVDQNNNPVTTDQRGFGRPSPADRSHCDIGAYEFGARPAPGSGIGGFEPLVGSGPAASDLFWALFGFGSH